MTRVTKPFFTGLWRITLFIGIAIGPARAGHIYIYQLPDGGRLITDQQRAAPGYRLIKTYRDRGLDNVRSTQLPQPTASRYDRLIKSTAVSHQVDSALVKAVVQVESAFDRYALSEKGASGLMQLMPATADRYGVDRVFDPQQNVTAGVRYLRDLLTQFSGNARLAVAGYNAGENAVTQYGDVPPYPETQDYVSKVLSLYQAYRKRHCANTERVANDCAGIAHRTGVSKSRPNIWRALGIEQ